MRRAVRILGVVVAGLAALVGCGIAYLFLAFPKYEAADPKLHVTATPAELARGQYLAEHVGACVTCHSQRDFSRFSGPVSPGTEGQGGETFGHGEGLPGEIVAPNITHAAIGSWSDGELSRAITSGVSKDGRALFPLMNYPGYATLCERDLRAVIGYVRTLPAIEHQTPATSLDFPVNLIVRTLPKPAATPSACPDEGDTVALGKYLVAQAACADCHTPRAGGQPVPGHDFAGGNDMRLPSGYTARSANITPATATGIGAWTRQLFVQRFAAYRNPEALHAVHGQDRNTPMPWSVYAGMTDADLGAIYDYLRTLPPVETGAAAVAAR